MGTLDMMAALHRLAESSLEEPLFGQGSKEFTMLATCISSSSIIGTQQGSYCQVLAMRERAACNIELPFFDMT
jgi:hypothetical protein